ncbi:MAG: phosphatidylinositol kinase [Zunongwangia sp.]|jgi:serine/threonine-protein kinase HipA|uniref:Phosphatidylinositol kinase n=1 Tax=Zunongwangia profunda TaxID=398743 RepID=A0A3D5J4N6_9FLAO|nr:HipA N-terminal domain-containing protein [Zunongwangia profunda]MAC64420.1 phosphatidylinositol kinase [Flavobacteriaceae bacterium]MAO34994.1 phosphatidylinositol kinase [Zunongwangia sp.]MAS71734.1 phosphatidylinositol kinase [Zunongwangia sp.]MCC4228665.1 HipA N-terminal domain-containing protein [Zunongwangia profunda]HCV83061.1 phosphatidylinositol kinase [Zunongwangia profunda]|tara:strand:- start:8373 stop:8705 length:333 start_codon:yes stop_codon:yes gene_type:complete
MRQARIFYDTIYCGQLTETNDGEFVFKYDEDYVRNYPDQFITFTMPVRKTEYKEKRLFAFFEGLIPEGWLLDIASKNWKINRNDRMGLLLACCKNCIGAVSVEPIPTEDE